MSLFSSGQLSSPSPPTNSHKTRYKRPESKKYIQSAPAELFAEGTTPTEGQMWRDRFSRRMIDRERRRKVREVEVDRRRGPVVEEEDEAKIQEDDEEIFRRLMVLQRQREQRNAQISYEIDNGGSDPISPDFWDEEPDQVNEAGRGERESQARLEMSDSFNYNQAGPSNYQTPQRPQARSHSMRHPPPPFGHHDAGVIQEEEEDQWAAEAARAEEAEREAEELELARQIEKPYQHQYHDPYPRVQAGGADMEMEDIEMDWDVDMDI